MGDAKAEELIQAIKFHVHLPFESGIASCRVCLDIARHDGNVVMSNGTADTSGTRLEQLPTVELPGITAEQPELIVATATGTA